MRVGHVFIVISLVGALLTACGSNDQSTNAVLQYPDAGTPAAMLYIKTCSQCHGAPLPTAHDASVWPGVVQRMRMHMTQKNLPPMSNDQLATIVDYLQSHAKK